MKKFIKFIKNLSDGGLAEDVYAAMERILDEDTNKEKMVNKQEFIEKIIEWVKNRDNVEKYLHVRTSLTDNFADALRKYLEDRL